MAPYANSDPPKRVLAVDGGGVRGALAVGILTQLEKTLREKLGRPDLVLADYFDLIGGTSTGSIIAAALALGRDTAYIADLYRRLGPRIFRRGKFRIPLIQARFDPSQLEAVVVEELGAATLGDAAWKTGFAAIAKRVDTASTWIWTNCPRAVYWEGDPAEIAAEPDPAKRQITATKDYPLSSIVRASAAAPFYFDMVGIEVTKGEPGVFFDGAMTPHGNPALQLAMAATIPAYGLGWSTGADNLLIVSVGTGAPRPIKPEWRHSPFLLSIWKALHALTSMAYDGNQLNLAILQWLGTSPQPWHINSEVGDLQEATTGNPPLWTFVRYDAPLEAGWLKDHLNEEPSADALKALGRLDDDSQIPALYELGLKAGETLIRPAHFADIFDPRP